ncbi:hypothetical protein [Methylobacterium mesophilicum]|uniref:hypothetical protein n=1 Tax=Methylobacterium mesophilicum TaxID=39956 RepID=UPI002F351DE8
MAEFFPDFVWHRFTDHAPTEPIVNDESMNASISPSDRREINGERFCFVGDLQHGLSWMTAAAARIFSSHRRRRGARSAAVVHPGPRADAPPRSFSASPTRGREDRARP